MSSKRLAQPGDGWANKAKFKRKKEDNSLDIEDYAFICFLCSSQELPDWHFKHRGLHSGYRTCSTFSQALYSLFYWHNESVNIWSHYICFVLMIWFSCRTWCLPSLLTAAFYPDSVSAGSGECMAGLDKTTAEEGSCFLDDSSTTHVGTVSDGFGSITGSNTAGTIVALLHSAATSVVNIFGTHRCAADHMKGAIAAGQYDPYTETISQEDAIYRLLLLSCNILGNAVPIFLSAFCHQFYCVSKIWHVRCWFLDFVGILTGMFFTGVSYVMVAFKCSISMRLLSIYCIVVVYIVSLQLCWRRYTARVTRSQLYPKDRFPEFSLILSTFGAITTAIPVLLSVVMLPEYTQDPDFIWVLAKSAVSPVLMAMGIVIFAQGGYPERLTGYWNLPTYFFDFVGHSHQFWHLWSAMLQFFWVVELEQHYHLRLVQPCAYH